MNGIKVGKSVPQLIRKVGGVTVMSVLIVLNSSSYLETLKKKEVAGEETREKPAGDPGRPHETFKTFETQAAVAGNGGRFAGRVTTLLGALVQAFRSAVVGAAHSFQSLT